MVRAGAFLTAAAMAGMWAATGARAEDKTADLPVSRVVLFSGGVAYFEHAGKVTGDATVHRGDGQDDRATR